MAFTDDQIMALNQAPVTSEPGISGPPMPPTPLSPWKTATAQFDAPGASMWDKLTDLIGQGGMPKMPGTTVGAPAGQTPPGPPPMPVFPPGQRPPGMGSYFQALQNPPQGGGLMAQYMALQQLMRGG